MRGQHICLLNDWKKKFACVHVFTFEDVIVSQCVCVCVRLFPAGPPPSIFPLSQLGILGDRSKPGSPRLPRLQALCANAARLRNAESFPQVAACADVQRWRPPTVSLTHAGSSHTLRLKCRT